MPESVPYQGRVVILTALPVEYQAVRMHLNNVKEETHKGTVYEQGQFTAGPWSWEVSLTQIGAGNNTAAFEAERAIAHFNPQVVLFVGIAGGLKDVSPGDVVVATKVYGYEAGKVVQEFLPRPDVGVSSYRLVQRAQAEARKGDWQHRIEQNAHRRFPSSRVFVGPIAAGEKVIASTQSGIAALLRSHYSDALAVEMEGRGFLQAAHGNEQVQALIVRGIANTIDNKKRMEAQGIQQMAAHIASAFAFEILKKLDVPAASIPSIPSLTSVFSAPREQATADLRLVDVYVDEDEKDPALDITLHNAGTQIALPKRAKIEILDVGEFYLGDEEQDTDNTRTFLMPTGKYDIELSPRFKGKVVEAKVAHLLQPGETERIQVILGQKERDPQPVYTWYCLKLVIMYNEQVSSVASQPILLSIPPMMQDMDERQKLWHGSCREQNLATLARISQLRCQRSASVAETINDLYPTISQSVQEIASVGNHVPKVDESFVSRQSLFVCYSHHDERYVKELRTHLAHYVRMGMIDYWDDTKILPGKNWYLEMQKALHAAKVAILLISADFFASDFITQGELPLVLHTAERQKITIFCVIVRPCIFKDTELAQFQAINDPVIPLSTMSYANREKEWVKVAEHVRDRLQARD